MPLPGSYRLTREKWLEEERAGVAEASFVALDGDDVVGYAGMQGHGEHGLTAVRRSHRRRGIARALVRWLEETALTAGTFLIGLELRAGNEAARALYHTLGYHELGQIPGYYQGVESAIRMMRDVRGRRESAPGAREQTP